MTVMQLSLLGFAAASAIFVPKAVQYIVKKRKLAAKRVRVERNRS